MKERRETRDVAISHRRMKSEPQRQIKPPTAPRRKKGSHKNKPFGQANRLMAKMPQKSQAHKRQTKKLGGPKNCGGAHKEKSQVPLPGFFQTQRPKNQHGH